MPNPEETPGDRSIDDERMRAAIFAKLFDVAAEPVMIGRYRVIDEIGAGGMGRVFSAYDQSLDRVIAIKVVHGELSSASAKARLRREAQALGRLAHPNVVAVHEVGEQGGQVFVAMELVRGQTLRTWRESAPRSVREVLAVYLQAARGLAAAHSAGILHRDFKPDNAILGEDRDGGDAIGRVRVVDFGLARGLDETPSESMAPVRGTEIELHTPLTRTGAVLGTPAYMAAEQHRGESTDARTDQFAFCVALWEALYEQRPFAGTTLAELATNVTAGVRRPPPRDRVVAPAVVRALDRGLASDPAGRHPDMSTLVAILERARAPARSRWWALAAVPVFGVVAFTMLREEARVGVERCEPAAERLAAVWDEDVRRRLSARYRDADRPYVAATWASFARAVDSVVGEWTAVYAGACEASRSEDQAERRLAVQRLDCLDIALSSIGGLVELAGEGEPEEFARSYSGWLGLRERFTCENAAIVSGLPALPTDPALAQEVARLRKDIVRGNFASASNQHKQALAIGENAVRDARALDHKPVLAEALNLVAGSQQALQDPAAGAALAEALRTAEATGHDLVVLDSLLSLVEIDAQPLPILDRIDAVSERLGSPAEIRVLAMGARTRVLRKRRAELEERELAEQTAATLGEDTAVAPFLRASAYAVLASSLRRLRDAPARLQAARRAVEILDAELGVAHPLAADAMDLAAHALFELARFEESIVAYGEIIALLDMVYPEGHPRLGWALSQRARGLAELGRASEAKADWLRAEAVLTHVLGTTHTETLRGPTCAVAEMALLEGDVDVARARVQRFRDAGFVTDPAPFLGAIVDAIDGKAADARATVTIELADLGAQPGPSRARTLLVAAYIEMVLGDLTAARVHAESAAAIPRAPGFVGGAAAAMIGWIRVEDGDYAGALPVLEEALVAATAVTPADVAWFSPITHASLAIALEATGGDHDRALRLAKVAIEHAKRTGPVRTGAAEKAAAWLAANEP